MTANEYRILSFLGISLLALLSRPAMAAATPPPSLTPAIWWWQINTTYYRFPTQEAAVADAKKWLSIVDPPLIANDAIHSGCYKKNYYGVPLSHVEIISTPINDPGLAQFGTHLEAVCHYTNGVIGYWGNGGGPKGNSRSVRASCGFSPGGSSTPTGSLPVCAIALRT